MRERIRSTFGTVTDTFDDGSIPTCVRSAARTWCGDEDGRPLQVITLELRAGTREALPMFRSTLHAYADNLSARLRMSTGIQCRVHYLTAP